MNIILYHLIITMSLWVDKYRPKTMADIVHNKLQAEEISKWLQNFKKMEKHAILIHGPPGIGKTSSIYAICNTLKYDIKETNASDKRQKKSLEKLITATVVPTNKITSFFKQKTIDNRELKYLLLMEEIDGMVEGEGMATLVKIIQDSKVPIICTCNDFANKKLDTIKKYVYTIAYTKIDDLTLVTTLWNILCQEKLVSKKNADQIKNTLTHIAEKCSGDLRRAINMTQFTFVGKKACNIDTFDKLVEPDKAEMINKIQSTRISDLQQRVINYIDEWTHIHIWYNYLLYKPKIGRDDFNIHQHWVKCSDIYSYTDVWEAAKYDPSGNTWSLYKYAEIINLKAVDIYTGNNIQYFQQQRNTSFKWFAKSQAVRRVQNTLLYRYRIDPLDICYYANIWISGKIIPWGYNVDVVTAADIKSIYKKNKNTNSVIWITMGSYRLNLRKRNGRQTIGHNVGKWSKVKPDLERLLLPIEK